MKLWTTWRKIEILILKVTLLILLLYNKLKIQILFLSEGAADTKLDFSQNMSISILLVVVKHKGLSLLLDLIMEQGYSIVHWRFINLMNLHCHSKQ